MHFILTRFILRPTGEDHSTPVQNLGVVIVTSGTDLASRQVTIARTGPFLFVYQDAIAYATTHTSIRPAVSTTQIDLARIVDGNDCKVSNYPTSVCSQLLLFDTAHQNKHRQVNST
jgi:hypothetical protein